MTPIADCRSRAFTLIELLAVLTVLAFFAGMLMPLIGTARRNARRSAATCDMARIEAAIGAFRTDAGHRPWLAAPTDAGGPWGNGLAYRLGHILTATERAALKTDLAAVGGAYAASGCCTITAAQIDQPADALTFSARTTLGNGVPVVISLNRIAAERGRIGVLSGNVGIARTVPNGGQPWKDGAAILASPATRGWTDDYLDTRMPFAGDDLLDPWGQPYVYVHPVVNGVQGFIHQNASEQLVLADWFGFASRPRQATAALDSDIRTHAATAYAVSHELWSAGPDGRFAACRTDPANRDDLPASPYLAGLR